jgi:hypothetical protein
LVNFPVYMGVTKEPRNRDLNDHQIWAICELCSCIQLVELLPLPILYKKNHHKEVVGEVWKRHHDRFAQFILDTKPTKILEIGGAHGYLAKRITSSNSKVNYTLVEPDSNLVAENIRLVIGYIEDHLIELVNQDTVVHSHVLEHMYNPVEFFEKVALHMRIGSRLIISIPNMAQLLKLGGMNSLNFEHTYLLTPEHLQMFFCNFGFTEVRREDFESHSIFFSAVKTDKSMKTFFPYKESIRQKVMLQSREFLDLIDKTRKFVYEANRAISERKHNTFLFGAHIFSQALVSMGLDETRIEGVLDNASSKQGSRLYGTNLKVFSPEAALRDRSEVSVVLRASHYQSEIVNQLREINPKINIIE